MAICKEKCRVLPSAVPSVVEGVRQFGGSSVLLPVSDCSLSYKYNYSIKYPRVKKKRAT